MIRKTHRCRSSKKVSQSSLDHRFFDRNDIFMTTEISQPYQSYQQLSSNIPGQKTEVLPSINHPSWSSQWSSQNRQAIGASGAERERELPNLCWALAAVRGKVCGISETLQGGANGGHGTLVPSGYD